MRPRTVVALAAWGAALGAVVALCRAAGRTLEEAELETAELLTNAQPEPLDLELDPLEELWALEPTDGWPGPG